MFKINKFCTINTIHNYRFLTFLLTVNFVIGLPPIPQVPIPTRPSEASGEANILFLVPLTIFLLKLSHLFFSFSQYVSISSCFWINFCFFNFFFSIALALTLRLKNNLDKQTVLLLFDNRCNSSYRFQMTNLKKMKKVILHTTNFLIQ